MPVSLVPLEPLYELSVTDPRRGLPECPLLVLVELCVEDQPDDPDEPDDREVPPPE